MIDLCVEAHDSTLFEDLFTHIPSGGRHFLGRRGDDLVTHAVVTTRRVQPEDHDPLRTAFVDAVSTRPKFQGRGYGGATMTRLAAEIDDYEIACLQTDEPGFYERLGWQLWPGPLAGRAADGTLIPTPDQRGVMVLRLEGTPELDLTRGLSIEQQPDRFWE